MGFKKRATDDIWIVTTQQISSVVTSTGRPAIYRLDSTAPQRGFVREQLGPISMLTIIGAMVISLHALPTQPFGTNETTTNETTTGSSNRPSPIAIPEPSISGAPMFVANQLPATPAPPTTTFQPRECYYNGKWYQPGEEISQGQSGTWCYGTYCDSNGKVTEWDDFYCPTPRPSVPRPQSSQQRNPWQSILSMMFGGGASTTSPSLYNYQSSTPPYDPFKQNSRSGIHRGGNNNINGWNRNNPVVGWDSTVDQSSWNQGHTTKSLIRTQTTTSSPIPKHKDQIVLNTTSPNQQITALDQGSSNRTHNTQNTLTGTASHNNIKSPRKFTPPSQPKRCYHNGQWFQAGQDISEGRRGSYCYGLYCDQNGEIQKWDDYNCNWNSQTATQPLLPHRRGTTDPFYPTSTPYYPTTPYYHSSTAWAGQTGAGAEGLGGGGGGGQGSPRGCNYRGQIIEPGEEIAAPQPLPNGQCLTRMCSETGRVMQQRVNCALAWLLRAKK